MSVNMELRKTELFHDVTLDTERNLKFSRIGYDYGVSNGLHTYMAGYKLGLSAMMEYYMSLEVGDTDKLDEIAIPIIFQSRHIVELYLKYFYMKFVRDKDQYRRVKPIITGTHPLMPLYEEIESALVVLCDKAGLPFCNEEIKNYIQQLDEIDEGSYAFRYPYNKELKSNFENSIAIDLIDYYGKITEFYTYFDRLNSELNAYFAKESYDKRLAHYLLESINKYWNVVETVYNIVNAICQETENSRKQCLERKKNQLPVISLADVTFSPTNENRCQLYEFIHEHGRQELEIVNLLLFSGRDLYYGEFKLAQNDRVEKMEDLKRLLILNWKMDFIHSKKLQKKNYKLLQTREDLILKWVREIMDVIEELDICTD